MKLGLLIGISAMLTSLVVLATGGNAYAIFSFGLILTTLSLFLKTGEKQEIQ